MFIVNSP